MKDIIIIGAGPAGVSAALYAKARGKDVLLLEKDKIGGLIANVSKVSHFAGVGDGETGPTFADRLADQVKYSDIPVLFEEATGIEKTAEGFTVQTNQGSHTAKKVIAATGNSLKELPIDLPAGFATKHWPLGQEESYAGKTVVINGGSDGASKEALYLAQKAKVVHMVQNQDKLLCIDEFKQQIEAADNIVVHTGCEVQDIKVEDGVCRAVNLGGEEITDEDGIEVYVQIGQNGNTDLLAPFAKVEGNFLAEDLAAQTEGLFFAGDIRVKTVRQIATAVADGCLAGIMACK
ncbi:NAD(P)/FAD-dependent oxidoreductase [Peptococcus simiae]|uniref:NAD(P)/FAD-dependent oxidoreductase n=1 Tax=Peptococcus simiae TaxID=1643805 RepID=UPI0039808B54